MLSSSLDPKRPVPLFLSPWSLLCFSPGFVSPSRFFAGSIYTLLSLLCNLPRYIAFLLPSLHSSLCKMLIGFKILSAIYPFYNWNSL
ncbi:hypothetical protein HK096_002719 [Nowakowskiella sp. JEL0078]|nr:hypothetical protein HK096_002719 [Nowakowskiella sp. JEL0078]